MKIAYITDSGSGKSIDEMAKDKIFSLPLQIGIDNKNYFDIEQVGIGEVLKALHEDRDLSSSQPSLGLIDDLFKKLKDEGFDKAICVPICSGLSGTMNALYMCGDSHDLDVSCLDTHVTACVEDYLVHFLKEAISDRQMEEKEAFELAKKVVHSTNTLLLPDDLHHLSKSGRLSRAAASIGTFFNIKPLLAINEKTLGRIDVLAKVRTSKKVEKMALEIMKQEIKNENYVIYLAHVDCFARAAIFKEEVKKIFPKNRIEIIPLCSPVALHTGLGCLAIQYFEQLTL